METELYTNKELSEIVENDGLSVAIQSSVDADWIQDPELKDLFTRAKELLDEIEDKLNG